MKFFTNMKKIKLVPLMLSALLLTACSKSGGTDISQAEQLDLSYMITTDLPCVNGSDVYNIEEYDIDYGGINGRPFAFDGESMYFLIQERDYEPEYSYSVSIVAHELKTGQRTEIFRESADMEKYSNYFNTFSALNCFYMGINDGILYWFAFEEYNDFVGYPHSCNARLFGYNTETGATEEITSLSEENLVFTEFTAQADGKLYFELRKHNGYFEYIKSAVYCYDLSKQRLYEVIDYGENPRSYKNGIVYVHDDALYYHGSDKVASLGVFYENDSMIYDPNKDNKSDNYIEFRVISGGDKLMYSCRSYSSALWNGSTGEIIEYNDLSDYTVGELDGRLRQRDIVSTAPDSLIYGFLGEETITKEFICFEGTAQRPENLIYDKEGEFFAVLSFRFPAVKEGTGYILNNHDAEDDITFDDLYSDEALLYPDILTCEDSVLFYGIDYYSSYIDDVHVGISDKVYIVNKKTD